MVNQPSGSSDELRQRGEIVQAAANSAPGVNGRNGSSPHPVRSMTQTGDSMFSGGLGVVDGAAVAAPAADGSVQVATTLHTQAAESQVGTRPAPRRVPG